MDKHDVFVEELCMTLDNKYEFFEKHVVLFKSCRAKRRRVVAEVDLIAYKDNYCDVYEVKCSYRITKARMQLKKIRKYVRNVKKTFFYCGESKQIVPVKTTH